MKTILLSTALALAGLVGVSAQAATINFNYAVPGDGSGKTTPFSGPNIFVETFDVAPGKCGQTGGLATVSGGTFGITNTTTGSHAAPKDDTTCYGYGPASDGTGSVPSGLQSSNPNAPNYIPLPSGVAPGSVLASVTIDYSPLIAAAQGANPGAYLNYFGLYYGSIDSYNMLEFFDAAGNRVDTVYGSQIIAACSPGCKDGDQHSDDTNKYVNLLMDPGEGFASIRFTTWGVAVEVDNLAVGFGVPEPTSVALIGAALVGLGFAQRRKAKKA